MRALLAALALLAFCAGAQGASLRERLTPDVLAMVMPGAERLGAEEASPAAIPVYRGSEVVAWLSRGRRGARGVVRRRHDLQADRKIPSHP
jgi:transcriptional regulator of nitric oxide reductase